MALSFGTIQGFKTFTKLSGVEAAPDPLVQSYLDRANSYMNRLGTFCSDQGSSYTGDMTVGIYLLAELFWSKSSESVVNAITGPYKSERIGTYSYDKGSAAQKQIFNPMDDFEIASIVNTYLCVDEVNMIRTVVFRELPFGEGGRRDYKDIHDFVFDSLADEGVESGSERAKEVF
jgi:hypothetical protein